MVTMSMFNDASVLNIFTDASIYKNGEELISSHGIYDPKNNFYKYSIYRNSTNNRGELMGIIDALQYGLCLRSRYSRINIWTDSVYSMKCITEWFPNWYLNQRKDGIIYNRSGQPVENQDLIKIAIDLILINDFKVNIFHQRGHILEKKYMDKAIYSFSIANKMSIDREAMHYAAVCNQIIDEYTRNMFLSVNVKEIPALVSPILPYFNDGYDIRRLLYLTKKYDNN